MDADKPKLSWYRRTMPLRLGIYFLVLGLIIYSKMRISHAPSDAETPAVKETVDKKSAPPELELPVQIPYPEATLSAWSRETLDGGAQRITALLRFTAHSENLEWQDLKLASPGPQSGTLAEALAPPGQKQPPHGAAKVVFELPAGSPEFKAGRILFSKAKELVALPADRHVELAQLEEGFRKSAKPDGKSLAPETVLVQREKDTDRLG